MPTGMSERRARMLAQQIEDEDERVKAIVQRCASENPWYESKTWEVVALLPDRNLKQRCYQPKHWASVKDAWNALREVPS
jgi:hypothetical protein